VVQLGMSALGHKRTFCDAGVMSALPPMLTLIGVKKVRCGPRATSGVLRAKRDRHRVNEEA
jgi:hypothetical protein